MLFLSSLTRAWTVKKQTENNKTIKDKADYMNDCIIISSTE